MATKAEANWIAGSAKEALKQVPGMVMLAVVVWMFLNYITAGEEKLRQTIQETSTLHHDGQQKIAETINRNSETINRNSETFGRVSGILERIEQRERFRERDRKE